MKYKLTLIIEAQTEEFKEDYDNGDLMTAIETNAINEQNEKILEHNLEEIKE